MAEGYLALTQCGKKLPLQVLGSRAEFYLGTTEDGMPFSRGSQEYWPSRADADQALRKGMWC
ncbi:hypothetical protein RDT67_28730 [Serratia fonticola]|uniref:Uncharacterized protein n=1 Tax=Serratia fonticola TaxID=47917 RepID=A0AAJ2DCN6_SERFO|nr:hypothetical protein [Serratia fonticola]MDQ9130389.1 hypothetical protein [Serratia fonticola]